MNDRIRKLAEAMGWTAIKQRPVPIPGGHPDVWFGIPPNGGVGGDGTYYEEIPDPFTDANDDYAVLEWMRRDAKRFGREMSKRQLWLYEVGDYARAAMKVLTEDE